MATANPGSLLTLQTEIPSDWTLADLQERLGGIPAQRIRLFPPPGCATEDHVIEKRLDARDIAVVVERDLLDPVASPIEDQ